MGCILSPSSGRAPVVGHVLTCMYMLLCTYIQLHLGLVGYQVFTGSGLYTSNNRSELVER